MPRTSTSAAQADFNYPAGIPMLAAGSISEASSTRHAILGGRTLCGLADPRNRGGIPESLTVTFLDKTVTCKRCRRVLGR